MSKKTVEEQPTTLAEETLKIFNQFNSLKNQDGTIKNIVSFKVDWSPLFNKEGEVEDIPNISINFSN